MKKGFFAVLLVSGLIATLGLSACGKTEAPSSDTSSEAAVEATEEQASEGTETEPEVDGSAYGYAGTDPIECAVYKYMVEEVGKNYDAADVSIPVVQVVHVDYTNPDEVLVSGDFWINNYNIEGDTLTCVSGGNHPGVMHVTKSGDDYVVSSFDTVSDGADFESSAQELFGDNYEAFMEVYGNADAREELRTITVSDYVNLNGLEVTQYQDFGWDPVELYK